MNTADARTPVIVAARRTPVAGIDRGLAHVDAGSLAAAVLDALVDDLGLDLPHRPTVDDVLLGNCRGPGGNVARIAGLASRLGTGVPGVTLDRQCGSGLEAVRLAAALVRAGEAEVLLAGGTESASQAPRGGADAPTPGAPLRAAFTPPGMPDPDMGEAAEALARARGIDRARQDAYAARSHALAVATQARRGFAAELVPVGRCTADDRPRPGLDAQLLQRFRPAFVADGTITAGNSCGLSDGAGAVAVVPESLRADLGVPGLRVRSTAVVGVDPVLPGLGAAVALNRACRRSGLSVHDLGAVEITEAFAAQVLACTDDLGLDPRGRDTEVVCAQGGALALGHPWGASGALLLVRLFARMIRGDGPALGAAACAIGGGQGIALVVERVA